MGGKDKDAKLFSAKHELKGHTGAVYAVQFSHDGRFLVSGSFDKSVRVWDTTNLSEVRCAIRLFSLSKTRRARALLG